MGAAGHCSGMVWASASESSAIVLFIPCFSRGLFLSFSPPPPFHYDYYCCYYYRQCLFSCFSYWTVFISAHKVSLFVPILLPTWGRAGELWLGSEWVLSCYQGLTSDTNTAGIKAIFSQRTSLDLAGEKLRIPCNILRFATCLSLPTCPACQEVQSLCLALRHKETKYISPTWVLQVHWPFRGCGKWY